MGIKSMKEKVIAEAAGKMMGPVAQDAVRILESLHAHLEKQLEVQRMIYDELKTLRQINLKGEVVKTEWNDEKQ